MGKAEIIYTYVGISILFFSITYNMQLNIMLFLAGYFILGLIIIFIKSILNMLQPIQTMNIGVNENSTLMNIEVNENSKIRSSDEIIDTIKNTFHTDQVWLINMNEYKITNTKKITYSQLNKIKTFFGASDVEIIKESTYTTIKIR